MNHTKHLNNLFGAQQLWDAARVDRGIILLRHVEKADSVITKRRDCGDASGTSQNSELSRFSSAVDEGPTLDAAVKSGEAPSQILFQRKVLCMREGRVWWINPASV